MGNLDLIDFILFKHKIYDIQLSLDENNRLIADDEDGNHWEGTEFYDFLYDEVFVYNEKGGVDLVDDVWLKQLNNYRHLEELSEKGNSYVTN